MAAANAAGVVAVADVDNLLRAAHDASAVLCRAYDVGLVAAVAHDDAVAPHMAKDAGGEGRSLHDTRLVDDDVLDDSAVYSLSEERLVVLVGIGDEIEDAVLREKYERSVSDRLGISLEAFRAKKVKKKKKKMKKNVAVKGEKAEISRAEKNLAALVKCGKVDLDFEPAIGLDNDELA